MANPWDFIDIWHTNCEDYPDFVGSICPETTYTVSSILLTSSSSSILPYVVSVACVDVTATEFEGLDHLEGETVVILADGVPQAEQVVIGGSITTSSAFGVVHVGLPYYSDFETLDIELLSDEDTVSGRKIKVGNVGLRFVDSRGGWLGDSFDDMYEAFTNLIVSRNQSELIFNENISTYNVSSVLYSGWIRRPLGSQYRHGGRVCYQQRDPLPVTITSISPEVSIGGPI